VSVGRGITKNDHRCCGPTAVVEQVWNALNEANKFAALLANTNIIPNDTFLTNLGYLTTATNEVTLLRAAINDLGSSNGLYGVAHGTKTQASVNNFFFNAQQITGVNYTG
jgi:hypothetical protein